MDHHPIPRQITTFEFKLIGFMTLKQFGYLAISSIIAFILFMTVPKVLYFNVFVGISTALSGAAFAFIKINERSLDAWISNFVRKIFSPSQFFYYKNNQPPAFLKQALALTSQPQIVYNHIDAQKKLSSYTASGSKPAVNPNIKRIKNEIAQNQTPSSDIQNTPSPEPDQKTPPQTVQSRPFFYGVVKNKKEMPLPNTILYVKDENDKVVRILKTNHLGVFATFHPLSPGDYVVDTKDLQNKHFFDTMNLQLQGPLEQSFNIYSREIV